MAAKAEVLTGTTASTTTSRTQDRGYRNVLSLVATAVRDWGRRGQLGSSANTEMGRYTGGRC